MFLNTIFELFISFNTFLHNLPEVEIALLCMQRSWRYAAVLVHRDFCNIFKWSCSNWVLLECGETVIVGYIDNHSAVFLCLYVDGIYSFGMVLFGIVFTDYCLPGL